MRLYGKHTVALMQSRSNKESLDIIQLSNVELVTVITAQLLEENYQYFDLWLRIVKSSMHDMVKYESKTIHQIINEAIQQCEAGIKENNATTMNLRAIMHLKGIGGAVDYVAAISLLARAIPLDHAGAMNSRAYMHYYGKGGDVDYEAAIDLYESAIQLGHAAAMNNRAYMHQSGEGGAVDYEAAIGLYESAIQLDHAGAMNNRAHMHHYGKGGAVDYAAAVDLYERATRLNRDMSNKGLQALYITIDNQKTALNIFERIWGDLARGLSFTDHTIEYLGTHCKASIIEKIEDNDSAIGTSLHYLKQMTESNHLTESNHPIAKILNHGADNGKSSEYKSILKRMQYIAQQRSAFYVEAKSKTSSLFPFFGRDEQGYIHHDVLREILFFAQPGYQKDLREDQKKSANPATASQPALHL